MRERKYMVWDYISQSMFRPRDVREITFAPDGLPWSVRVTVDGGGTIWLFDFELLDWTGYKDINGVDIFEGHIMKHSSRKRDYYFPIVFKDGQFKHGDPGLPFAEHFSHGRVAGDIFRNSKLLERQ